MNRILVAGATGYLGRYILKELQRWDFSAIALARTPEKLDDLNQENIDIVHAEATKPETIKGVCNGVDAVISTIGITRQKDGLTYMDVDYQANLNLLKEAADAGVQKFIYVSVLNGQYYRYLRMAEAKERFVDKLKSSGLNYTIIRPNGFFSDMSDFLDMAEGGKVYLFGNGEHKLNPIHGADLAEICVQAIALNKSEIEVGGPDILTHNEIAELALLAWNKPLKIVLLPDILRVLFLRSARLFTTQKTYGPLEFFLTMMERDHVATRHGNHRLQDFFNQQVHLKRQTMIRSGK
jgi:uncharacterized protein YbjT (DUF2867 family)